MVEVDGFSLPVDLLLPGSVDATIDDSLSYLDFKARKPEARLKLAAAPPDAERQAVIMRKDNPSLVAAIDEALADMMADDTCLAISMECFGEDVS